VDAGFVAENKIWSHIEDEPKNTEARLHEPMTGQEESVIVGG
jgi:hypothetical protein